MTYIPGKSSDRRKGADLWLKTLGWLSVVSWALMFAALVLFGKARPQIQTYIDTKFNVPLRAEWNIELANYLFYLMIVGLFLSLAGIVINLKRHRRRNDEFIISLIMLGIVSLAGIIFYLFFFL
ncbi:MAG: hypothetical protein KKE17_03900 [Proteobacteria bacterium]|nr:hypothetical protein [Pseudomonadota bacterium]MBU1709128.1 hypothetical protein [Pseudomonadota bacterium]